MQQCQVIIYFVIAQAFDPNEWCLKNGHLSGALNPRPLSHESSSLTTRPQVSGFFVLFLKCLLVKLYIIICQTFITDASFTVAM